MTTRTDITSTDSSASLRIEPRTVEIAEPWPLLSRAEDVVFWRSRDSAEFWVGLGSHFSSDALEECRAVISRLEHRDNLPFAPRCFGALAFDPCLPHKNEWSGFATRRFWIPQWLLRFAGGKVDAIAFTAGESIVLPRIEVESPGAAGLNEVSSFDRDSWGKAVERIREEIASKRISKAVLSRRLEIEFDRPLDAAGIFKRLAEESPETYLYGLRQPESGIFFGASPECLFRLNGRRLVVDSLAGSRPRDTDRKRDDELRAQLAASDKDHREQRIVTDYIFDQLNRLCGDLTASATRVRDLATVRHLHTEISGSLNADVSSEVILNTLHPTPAVCGMPRDEARKLIAALEPDVRGLYAGAIGWADADSAEFAVAIRSGLIRGNHAMLFAGAGIVADSAAQNEYDECEWKLAGLRKAFFRT